MKKLRNFSTSSPSSFNSITTTVTFAYLIAIWQIWPLPIDLHTATTSFVKPPHPAFNVSVGKLFKIPFEFTKANNEY
jgi:hypothetical protein